MVVEFVVMGYVINMIFAVLYTVYAVVKALSTATPLQMAFISKINKGKKQKRKGAFYFPYAILLDIALLIKEEIDFNKSYPDKNYIDFLSTRYDED